MYCPNCMIEIQHNSEGTCPYCSTPLAQKPPLPKSQEEVFFLEDEMDNTVGEKIGGDKVDAAFRQILDAHTGQSEDISVEQAIDADVSNTSWGSQQHDSQQLLDKAFEESTTDDEPATTPSVISLAISLVLGALLLVCVIGAGIYYLNHIPAHETIMQKPERILSLPSSNAPAPTFKNSLAAEQQSQSAKAQSSQDVAQALQDGLAQQTPAAGVGQKSSSSTGESAPLQPASQSPPEQMPAQARQKNDTVAGGNNTQQSSKAASLINSVTDSGTSSHMLLCGSFQDKNKALNLAKKIKAKGYPAFVEKADLELKGIWYRIKIGGYSSKNAAEKVRDELKVKLKLEAVVAKQK